MMLNASSYVLTESSKESKAFHSGIMNLLDNIPARTKNQPKGLV